tara:strand:+ start:389 stop:766 length:378 start_codon:yes stop_codon:yes gene_type:complete
MNLLIQQGKNTPRISGDSINSILVMEGSSFPENVRKFYTPINDWLDSIVIDKSTMNIDCKFYYLASSSIIALLKTLKHAERLFGNSNISIKWRYEEDDDDIRKIGEDFSHLLGIEFEFIEEPEEV